jgi:uncharacterized SAM-binding protein YcdF (DUF218 family)/lysophospholipase L1-like esterase
MRRWSFRRGFVSGVLLVLLAQFTLDRGPLADWLVSPLLLPDTGGAAEVIVVSGAGVVGACEPNLSAVRRVLKAADLWRRARAPIVLFTGGAPPSLSCAISDVMADLAVTAGIPREHILTEATSHNTYENAMYATPVLRSLGARQVVLVTDRLHMLRASRSMAAFGYRVERASVPVYATHRGNLDMLMGGIREAAALGYYWARGRFQPVSTPAAVAGTPWEAGVVRAANESQTKLPSAGGPIVLLGASYVRGWNLTEVAGIPVINKGIDGEESFRSVERFKRDVIDQHPGSVLLWGFINDIHRAPRADIDMAVARIKASYSSMIQQGRANGIDVILATEVTITGPDTWTDRMMAVAGRLLGKTSYQGYVNAHVRAMNEWIRATARQEGLLLLDLEPIVAGANGERRREFAQPDGTHLTASAYEALTRYSRPVLERHFRGAP